MNLRRTIVMLLTGLFMAGFAFAGFELMASPDQTEPEGHVVNLTLSPVKGAVSYRIYRLLPVLEGSTWRYVSETSELKSDIRVENDIETAFKAEALDEAGLVLDTATSQKVSVTAKWFNTKRMSRFIAFLLILGFTIYYITRARHDKEIYLRPIAGLQAFEEAVGRATEMGRSVLYVPGIMDLDQVETISGVIILGHVAKMTARYETDLNVPVSRSLVMEAAREMVSDSYLHEGRPDLFSSNMVQYYTDDQFAFAAAVDGIMLREKPAAVFLQGKFYAESLILAETGNSIGAIQIAGTGSPSQIPFFVTACDYTLIGEEFFAASAYLGKDPRLLGTIKAQDIIKGILMGVLVVGVILETFNIHFLKDWFTTS